MHYTKPTSEDEHVRAYSLQLHQLLSTCCQVGFMQSFMQNP